MDKTVLFDVATRTVAGKPVPGRLLRALDHDDRIHATQCPDRPDTYRITGPEPLMRAYLENLQEEPHANDRHRTHP